MKRKEKLAHSVSLSCEYVGICIGEGKFDASSAAMSSRSVGFEWRVKAGAHGHAAEESSTYALALGLYFYKRPPV